ncbi:LysR family transcriptional regulator [Paenibacillus piri]|uniref:LysR family transcriptional regulator n=1 Tax=Paenibacillus piri TaxID=2547395 RepID=A0A4R5KTJ2_9BACL|nr:LysR family transcriptional regulator [Paenibacillus piri]TDF99181.1 LysR family transcriptional regulator [Paenibacillus piri]
MDLTYFRTFREVARRRSFTRAGEELGYAQSSVTTQMQKLEREYGVQLFERYGRQLRLTPPGEELLKFAVQMLDVYDQSKERIANQLGGTLTIGTIDSLAAYYLPPFLQQLKRRLPDLSVQLFPEAEAALTEKVREGEFDIGLLLDTYPADPALHCIRIREEQLILIAPPHHSLAQLDIVGLQALKNTELIVTEESCVYRGTFEKLLKDNGIPFQIGFELGSLEAIKQCVANGLGIALLPQIAALQEVRQGTVVRLPFSHEALRLELQLVVHPKKWMSQALVAFIGLLGGSANN